MTQGRRGALCICVHRSTVGVESSQAPADSRRKAASRFPSQSEGLRAGNKARNGAWPHGGDASLGFWTWLHSELNLLIPWQRFEFFIHRKKPEVLPDPPHCPTPLSALPLTLTPYTSVRTPKQGITSGSPSSYPEGPLIPGCLMPLPLISWC